MSRSVGKLNGRQCRVTVAERYEPRGESSLSTTARRLCTSLHRHNSRLARWRQGSERIHKTTEIAQQYEGFSKKSPSRPEFRTVWDYGKKRNRSVIGWKSCWLGRKILPIRKWAYRYCQWIRRPGVWIRKVWGEAIVLCVSCGLQRGERASTPGCKKGLPGITLTPNTVDNRSVYWDCWLMTTWKFTEMWRDLPLPHQQR